MERRKFIRSGFLSGAAAAAGTALFAGTAPAANVAFSDNDPVKKAEPFKLKFSPDFGMFANMAGKDPVDQIKWGYDQGFRAWENTFLKDKSTAEQERISKTIQQLGMEFGQFVGTLTFSKVTFAGRDAGLREQVIKEVKESVEIAKRMNTRFIHNVLGLAHPSLPYDLQMLNAIELLKQIAGIYEPHGIVMVMETMNHKVNHPGMFLHILSQAYALARAVGSPSVKMLYDFYHVQIEEGNLLPVFDSVYDEIAYVQVGDTPGRKEPTTGEINFPNALKHVYEKGYRGFVGLEHGNSLPGREGELATLAAYRSIDVK